MKKLLFVALAALTLGCYNDDFERVDGDINELRSLLAQSDINNAALVAALQERAAADLAAAEARVAELAASLTTQAQSVLDAAVALLRADITAVEEDLAVLQQVNGQQNAVDGALARAIAALQGSVGDLEDDLEDLEDDFDDLEDEVDDLDIDLNTITWTPTFSTQTAAFTQVGTSLSGTTSRVIAIGTTTSTLVINSNEFDEDIDVDQDGRHTENIRRIQYYRVYTGTVSGSTPTVTVGSHTVTGTLTDWRIVN